LTCSFSALADNVARAVEGANLYSDLRRRADQLTLVSEVSKSVTSTLDLSQLMREAAKLIHENLGIPMFHFSPYTPPGVWSCTKRGAGNAVKNWKALPFLLMM
jgi:hypothetical protein